MKWLQAIGFRFFYVYIGNYAGKTVIRYNSWPEPEISDTSVF